MFCLIPVLPGGWELQGFPWQRQWEESHRFSTTDTNTNGSVETSVKKTAYSFKYPSEAAFLNSLSSFSYSKPRPPKIFECPRCHQKFGHRRSIYRHRKACEGQFDFRCDICEKTFYRLDSLKIHIQKHADLRVSGTE